MSADLHVAFQNNRRDAAYALRQIADEIDAGVHGKNPSCAVVILGNQLEVFCNGPQSDPGDALLLLAAASQKLVTPIVNYGVPQ